MFMVESPVWIQSPSGAAHWALATTRRIAHVSAERRIPMRYYDLPGPGAPSGLMGFWEPISINMASLRDFQFPGGGETNCRADRICTGPRFSGMKSPITL